MANARTDSFDQPEGIMPSGALTACGELVEATEKPIEGTVRVDYGPGATAYIRFRNVRVNHRAWLGLDPNLDSSYRNFSRSKIGAMVAGFNPDDLARMENNAAWRAQGWAFLVPFVGRILATEIGVLPGQVASFLTGSHANSGWHFQEAIQAIDVQAKRLRDQYESVCRGVNASVTNPFQRGGLGEAYLAYDQVPDRALATLKLDCFQWSSLSAKEKSSAVRSLYAREQVITWDYVAIVVDAINTYCARQSAVQLRQTSVFSYAKPSGALSDQIRWSAPAPAENPIVLTSKNYLVGLVAGAAAGAAAMHFYMNPKSRSNPSKRRRSRR